MSAPQKGEAGGHAGRRFRSLRSRRFQLYGAAGLLAYVLVSTSSAMVLNGVQTDPVKELFPFFSWSLFSKVENERIEYSILIAALDDRTFAEPLDIRRVDDLPAFKGSLSLRYKAMQNLGRAMRRAKDDEVPQRGRFEARYFGPHDVDYEVVRHVFEPLRRWRGEIDGERTSVLGRFAYQGRSS